MKYEITESQLMQLVDLQQQLRSLAGDQWYDGDYAVHRLAINLRGLIEHIEMQDIKDVLEITPDDELALTERATV